jgi:GT2 family glycosyltransferase/tetratricopeptide (TPR) repeat protein
MSESINLSRLIAFYLPQYHPIPENDTWWGKGFTEWTNVGKAKPLFEGHYQPRLPADLGYYDLRVPEVRQAQAALARQYGIHGFCYYHYWFNGRRLLERPVNDLLASGEPDFPFCLCWANENWTRAWDGLDRQVLIRQEYRADDDLAHIRWLAKVFRDPRYIRIEGKPLFLVYRVGVLPDVLRTVTIWREEARKLGIGELFLACVESRVGGAAAVDPRTIGFDAAVEFQPDGLHVPKPVRRVDDYGGIYDYGALVENMLRKPAVEYRRFGCVAPGWDNSARRKENPTIITGSSPELYERWLHSLLSRQTPHRQESFVFINAWNEWAEGAYLEPDQAWGHAYLEATRRALTRAREEASRATIPIEVRSEPARFADPTVESGDPDGAAVPRVSLGIPVYNGNRYLEEAIRSILAQSYSDFELNIVDDCSSEDPEPILRKFSDPRIKFFRNPVRRGLVGNWNRCLELARGQYVCLFHQDDVMDREFLCRKVEMLDKHPSAGLVYSDARVVEADLTPRHERWFTPTEPNRDALFQGREFFEKLISGDNLICCPGVVIRRRCYQELGGFDPQLPYTADWEMWLRIAVNFDVAYVSAPLLDYRVHEANETHRFKGLKELEQSFRAKMLALARAKELLPKAEQIKKRVGEEIANKTLAELNRLKSVLAPKEQKVWLAFAAEAHQASLETATFSSAVDWFVNLIEKLGGMAGEAESFAEEWSHEEEQLFAQAKQCESKGQLDRATAILERLAATRPKSLRAWLQLARLQMGAGRLDKADAALSFLAGRPISDRSKGCEIFALRGRVRDAQRRKMEALNDFAQALQYALEVGRPDLAREIDSWMVSLHQGKPIPSSNKASSERLQEYARQSALAQAIGLAIGRPGPISTYELERAIPIWSDLLAGKSTVPAEGRRFEGWEEVIAGMAKLYLRKALDRNDTAVLQQAAQAWSEFTSVARGGSVPETLLQEIERLLPERASHPLVSIIIPTLNRLDLTRRCLESIRQDDAGSPYEVIVVDNGSRDGTTEFLKTQQADGQLRSVLNSENVGFARACNQGARLARGEHLLFLNNDTEVRAGWLDALIEIVQADKNVSAVGSKLLFPDGTIQHAGVAILDDRKLPDPLVARHIHYRKPASDPGASVLCAYPALTAACLLVRRAAFDSIGGFDDGFWNGYEDIDLCFRLSAAGGTLVYQPSSVVVHHESQSGPERFRAVGANIQRLHEKWLGKVAPDFVVTPEGSIHSTGAGHIRPYVSVAPPTERVHEERPVVSIVVLVHNQLEHTRRCFGSVRAHTSLPYELIVVDNGSTDGTVEYLGTIVGEHPRLRVIRNEKNLGFAKGNNQGLARAQGDCVLLLNNDTVVTDGWVERLLAVLQQSPDVGIVGPMSNYVAGLQRVADVPYRTDEELVSFAAEWSTRHSGKSCEASRVVGFCLLARRAVLDRIGGLDERFGTGNFEDDDFCLRAGLAGFQIRVAQEVFIHHTGNQTFKGSGIDYRAAMERNWLLFKNKWGIPAEAPLEQGYRVPLRLADGSPLKVPLVEDGPPSAANRQQKPAPVQIPDVAALGRLNAARELLRQKQGKEAWLAALEAAQTRPFHPGAFLFLGQIAETMGDIKTARLCAEQGRALAPAWKPVRKFLNQLPKHQAPLPADWPPLPPTRNAPPRLTVCLIAKNEEAFLGRCLKSVRALAHQIVLVDTGSTDRTVDIAKEHGAEVYSFVWCDDFSAARNAALEHATGDWILMLDADEELSPEGQRLLGKHLVNSDVIAWRLPLIDVGREADGATYVPRLFRNAPGVYFQGRVHEQVFGSLEVCRQEWGLDNRLGEATLLHYGYTPELTRDRMKAERNLRLLRLAVEEQPGDPHLQMHLGLEQARSGAATEALASYRQAFALLSALPIAQVVPELRETLLMQFATRLTAAKEFHELRRVLTSALAKAQGGLTASLHFVLGLACMELGHFAEAAEQMRHCLQKRHQRTLSPVHQDIATAAPKHCLALSLAQLGKSADAEKAFQDGLKETGNVERLRLDYARFLFEQNRPLDALKCLHASIAGNSTNPAFWRLGGQIALSRPEFLDFLCDWTTEAVRYVPNDSIVLTQRAEALLLSNRTEEARGLWQFLWRRDHQPNALAAQIWCELAEGKSLQQPGAGEVAAVSRAFVEWYRKSVNLGAEQTIRRVNERCSALREALPEAAQLIETVIAEASAQSSN